MILSHPGTNRHVLLPSVWFGEFLFPILPQILVDLLQGEFFQSIKLTQFHEGLFKNCDVSEVFPSEVCKVVDFTQVDQKVLYETIVDWIHLWAVVAAVFSGEREKLDFFAAFFINHSVTGGDICYKRVIALSEAFINIEMNDMPGDGENVVDVGAIKGV